MWASNLACALSKIVKPAAWWSIVAGGMAVCLMMATVVVDVTARFGFSKGILGNMEIAEVLLIIVFFSGYAHAELKGKHIQVRVLVDRLPPAVRQLIITNGYFLTLGIAGIIGWQYVVQGMFYKNGNIITGLLGIPLWPFALMAAFFMALFILGLLVTFLTHLAQLLTTVRTKAYSCLLPGLVLALGLFVFSFCPSLLPSEIGKGMWGGTVFLLLFGLMFLGIHIGAVMAVVALFGLTYLSGVEAGLSTLSLSAIGIASTYSWTVVPLFMWMGMLAYHGGFARELYHTAYKWVGHLPGGLASASVAACAGLAAITGSSMTGVVTMGTIALPEMRTYKYDMKLATATISTASTIGAIIPPSITFIVIGMLTEVSIGKLFIAGIFPGILFTILLIIMISIRCRKNPELGPPGIVASWKERVVSLGNVWAVILLVILCLGGLYMGVFTPTEAGGIGAGGALAISLMRRRLTFKAFLNSTIETVEMVAVIFFIFVFAVAFTRFIAATNLPYGLAQWVIGLNMSPYSILALILLIYVILGCIMNALPAVILTLPIFFPIAIAVGFDPVWFGVLIAVMAEMGMITPPIGMNVFAMSAIATDVPLYAIFRGVLPFWGAFIVLTIILVLFPQISLFLPSFM